MYKHKETNKVFILRRKYQDIEGRKMFKLSEIEKGSIVNINEEILNFYFKKL